MFNCFSHDRFRGEVATDDYETYWTKTFFGTHTRDFSIASMSTRAFLKTHQIRLNFLRFLFDNVYFSEHVWYLR